MGERVRPKKSRGLASGNRLHEAAEAAARAAGGLFEVRPVGEEGSAGRSPDPGRDDLREELAVARRRLREAEEGHARALARAAQRWENERSVLETKMTSLVEEIGAAKHIVERVGELEAELERVRAEVLARDEAVRAAGSERERLVAEIEGLRALLAAPTRIEGAKSAGAALAAAAGASRGTA